ncbi:MAG: hypothetical protein ABIA02_00030 [Candidatus Falkowbacteria bacterium]
MKKNITKNTSIFINGGKKVCGQVKIGGDKISAVHLLFALLISNEKTEIRNMSFCGDVINIIDWIKKDNIAEVKMASDSITISPNNTNFSLTSISKSRASICLVTAVALKFGSVKINYDIGGCCFTDRSINRHLDLIKAFGISVSIEGDKLVAVKKRIIHKIKFDCSTEFGPSVGVTEHALIASMVFNGEVILTNVALEPVSKVLINFLQKSTNRKVELTGRVIKINAVKEIEYCRSIIILPFDTTVALTYISMAIATGGSVYLNGVNNLISSIDELLRKMNVQYSSGKDGLNVCVKNIIHPGIIECAPWPGIPSDVGPIILAGLCGYEGITVLTDRVYNKRSTHVEGLNKMGFCLSTNGQSITVKGQNPNNDIVVANAIDIRAGAALAIGALSRNSKTIITDAYQIFRGYQNFIDDLYNLGVDIAIGGKQWENQE